MRSHLHLLIYCLCTIVISGDIEEEEEMNRKKIIGHITKTRTVLLDDYHLVTRQIVTDVYTFKGYRTVFVVFYPIMRDVTNARFNFQTEDVHMNSIGSCEPEQVVINIKHGSYPAVNPDGYPFPKNFIDSNTREPIHSLELFSDSKNVSYNIQNPKPGNWYALIYIKWTDPRTQKVEQKGLTADCQTILYTDLQVQIYEDIEIVECDRTLVVSYEKLPAYFKCMSADHSQPVSLALTITNTPSIHTEILFQIQALTLPTVDDYILKCAFDPKQDKSQNIKFIPNPNAWHYIYVDVVKGNASQYADCESYLRTDFDVDDSISNHTLIDLMRDDKGRFFTFDYGLPTPDLNDATSLVNLTSGEIKTLRFKVNQFLDIGGSLTIEASLLMSLKYYMGYRREYKKGSLLAFSEDNQFIRAVACLDIGYASIPLRNGRCKYNDKEVPAFFVLNSTDSETIYDKGIIPFPDTGTWYLTFRLFCDEVVCPCPTSDNGTKYYVGSELNKDREFGNVWNDTREGTSECNATVVLSISSMSCVNGRCSNHGDCLLNTFGGLVMSFCFCTGGYGGWDCSDDSRVGNMLLAILLLTLSNLLFILSVYVACIRLYYTEAVMYMLSMVFSTLYHACDASQQQYCIIKGEILQFGDFYCGLMAFWVTLLAMSVISDIFRSSLLLIGAIFIALLTTWDLHSFVTFMLPVAIGTTVLLISWSVDYFKNRKMRYPRSYYIKHMPLGIILVFVGLICFGFLQTEYNYKVVHSMWHIIVALSVCVLLPDVKRGVGAHPFKPSSNYCRLSFCRVFRFRRSPAPIAVATE